MFQIMGYALPIQNTHTAIRLMILEEFYTWLLILLIIILLYILYMYSICYIYIYTIIYYNKYY